MEDRLALLPEYQLASVPEGALLRSSPKGPPDKGSLPEWKYPKMYKTDAKGVRREWFGAVLQEGIVTSHGTVDGVKTISEPYAIELNTSGRDFVSQAALQLRYRYEIKFRKEGYRFPGAGVPMNSKPMTAYDWWKRPASFELFYPVAVQPKLDGIRCLVKHDLQSDTVMYRSRGNKNYNFGYLFDEEIRAMLPYFPFEVEFDGELYIHGLLLQQISSVVSLKLTEADLKTLKGKKKADAEATLSLRNQELKYNIFTIITPINMAYEDRRRLLQAAYEAGQKSLGRPFEKIVLVEDCLAESEDEIAEIAEAFTSHGYEGAMIYKLGCSLPPGRESESYYRSARTWNIIKYKPFEDEEMTIIAVKGGKGKAADLAGCSVVDTAGIQHEVNIAKEDSIRKKIFDDPSSVIGKLATVKHYGRTEDGKLRHANIIAIRDYE